MTSVEADRLLFFTMTSVERACHSLLDGQKMGHQSFTSLYFFHCCFCIAMQLRPTLPSLPYHKPVQYHNMIVLYVTAISKVVIVVFLKTTINVRLGQYSGNCCFQKNNNYDFDIVVAYSTIRLWYYTGLWYGRLGGVGLN